MPLSREASSASLNLKGLGENESNLNLIEGIFLKLNGEIAIDLNNLWKEGQNIFTFTDEGITYYDSDENEQTLIKIEDIVGIDYKIKPEFKIKKPRERIISRQQSYGEDELKTTKNLYMSNNTNTINIPINTSIQYNTLTGIYSYTDKDRVQQKIDFENLYSDNNLTKKVSIDDFLSKYSEKIFGF